MAGSLNLTKVKKHCYIFKTGREIDLKRTGFDSWMIYASLNAKISEILFLKKFRYIAPLSLYAWDGKEKALNH